MTTSASLSSSLLFSDEEWTLPEDLYSACWKALGLYSPLQFVLRLRPDVHRALTSAPAGLVESGELSSSQIRAFSTYLHETIHWWQHVGTTSGLLLSLLYPAQAHVAHPYLLSTLGELGPIKPLRTFNMSAELQAAHSPEVIRRVNVVLNNWHDIEFCRRLITDPKTADRVLKDQYFESVGHSYAIAIASVVSLLASTVDSDHHLFPDPQKWEDAAVRLHASETAPSDNGRTIRLPSLGAKEIFEGQARISQIQYLQFASGGRYSWADFARMGMLAGVYIEAFETFLRASGIPEPLNPESPTVGLFLLVCDIALNPAEGLLADPDNFQLLVHRIDPGWRFLRLCAAISQEPGRFLGGLSGYTTAEYYSVSEKLCEDAAFASPREIANRICSAAVNCKSIAKLLQQDRSFEFDMANLPVRLFAARFLAFQLDKAEKPNFFCWPGICMSPGRSLDTPPDEALCLFEEHRALFLDKEDGDVYPRTFEDRAEAAVDEVFNTFYAWVSTYELTRQWIVSAGEFDCSFSWLTSKHPESAIQEWASKKFREVYGVSLSDFRVLRDEI